MLNCSTAYWVTMYCKDCGANNDPDAKFCKNCGRSLGTSENPYGQGGEFQTDVAAMLINKKSEGLALILSFLIPGLGQLYLDKTNRGILCIAVAVVLVVLTAFTLVFGIVYLVFWIYVMYDAYDSAREYNQYLLRHNGQPPW